MVYLHGFLEPAIGAVDQTTVTVDHLLRQTDIISLWCIALWRMTKQRRWGAAVQAQHEYAALNRVQILLIRLVYKHNHKSTPSSLSPATTFAVNTIRYHTNDAIRCYRG